MRPLERMKAWQIPVGISRSQVGYRKPFSRNADGTLNKQFGSPVALDLRRWGTRGQSTGPYLSRSIFRSSRVAVDSYGMQPPRTVTGSPHLTMPTGWPQKWPRHMRTSRRSQSSLSSTLTACLPTSSSRPISHADHQILSNNAHSAECARSALRALSTRFAGATESGDGGCCCSAGCDRGRLGT